MNRVLRAAGQICRARKERFICSKPARERLPPGGAGWEIISAYERVPLSVCGDGRKTSRVAGGETDGVCRNWPGHDPRCQRPRSS